MNKIRIGVAGAGAMGSGIAQVAAMAGHSVLLYDTRTKAIEQALHSITDSLNKLEAKGKLINTNATEIIKRLSLSTNLHDFEGTGFVIEAVTENAEIKKSLFAEIEKKVSADCILASNTSSLSIASLSAACQKPGRMLGVHFFNPPVLMRLVEMVPSVRTSKAVIEQATALVQSWNKTTVLARDTPGFIVNRIARPYYSEAIRMLEEQMATVSDIDHAMKSIGGFKMGPFELMDFIGNDVNYTVTETVWQQMFYDTRYRPSFTQKRLFEAGMYGIKTGRGYYEYQNGKPLTAPPSRDKDFLQSLFIRILVMLINEAAETLRLGIASKEDIETAMQLGVNYPKGLLHWADELGIEFVVNELTKLNEWYGEERYRPSVLLKKMAKEQTSFF